MRHLPTILLVLSFPAGIIGYTLAADVLEGMTLPTDARSFVVLFVPLFVAGLVMMPFLIPFIDRKAKADLAAYRAIRPTPTGGSDGGGGGASPDEDSAPPNDQAE